MARKNRSNNSFAPIVITVLVAGVVGYYAFIKSPPQSTLAEGDGQGGFAFERAPDSPAGKPSTGTASKLGGDSTTSGIFTPKSPLDATGSKLVEPDRHPQHRHCPSHRVACVQIQFQKVHRSFRLQRW